MSAASVFRSEPGFVTNSGLRDVSGFNDQSTRFEDLFPVIPGLFRIKRNAHRGCQHRRSQIFRIIACDFVNLPVKMVFGQVSVLIVIGWKGDANR